MIKVSVLYPYGEGKKFDMNYYCEKHLPMVKKLVGPACLKTEVELGLAGGAPGAPPLYMAMGHLFFDSMESFGASFPQHMAELTADIPNYTDTIPVLQFSEVKM